MTVETLALWPRVRERAPFDAAEHNRLVNFLQGYIAAPFRLVQSSGSFALIWSPTTDLFTFGASIRFNATLTLDNTIWLDGYKADHTTSVHLIRVNASDIIELGATNQRLSFQASLTNNSSLAARDAANGVNITLVKLNTSDVIEIGETNQRITVAGALTNATYLDARNAANGANIHLIRVNASDVIEVAAANQRMTLLGALTNDTGLLGRDAANANSYTLIKLDSSDRVSVGESTRRTNLLGTVSAPAIDPPTIDGQVTAESQLTTKYSGSIAAGVLTNRVTYNISNAVRNLAGDYTLTWSAAYATAFYTLAVTVEGSAQLTCRVNSKVATSADIHFENMLGVKTDPAAFHVIASGTLA